MMRVLWASALLIGLGVGVSEAGVRKAVSRPNIIVIIADDVGWNDIGCYGHPHIRTPNLDKLARQGMLFTHAFLTTSSCSPSRSSIMTGRYPHSTGAAELHQPLPADQVVFAGLLKRAGYYTAAAGKWHLGQAARVNFDLIVGGGPSGAEKWVKVLKERPRDKPFFLWFASFDAHRPYKKNTIAQPHGPKDVIVPPFLPDNAATRGDLALYYDEVTRLDQYIGRVLAELERQGVAENTIVIFLSDNGRPFPRCKTTLYDSGIRTPFVVRWPERIRPGSRCTNLISAVDIAPTLLKVAGVKSPPTFQGKSFARMFSDPKAKIREQIFAEHNWHDYQAHRRAVRTKDFLYIWNAYPHLSMSPPADAVRSPTYQAMIALEKAGKLPLHQRQCFIVPTPREELYDLRKDPFSLRNVASDKRYRATLLELRSRLEAWKLRTADFVPPQPTPDRYDRWTGKRISPKR